jgi:predicted phosphoadenosine phosphosulfate sulfurtransferase
MKIFSSKNVFDKALERMRYIFDEFEEVIVSYSGGKDSTVIYELARVVAKEKGKLPLKVLFIDQEAEWTGTIKMVEGIMRDPDVTPLWYQMPILIENSATFTDVYQDCWGIGEEWIRDKVDISIKENTYGCDKWTDGIFGAIAKKDFKRKTCCIAGIRADENPTRFMAVTQDVTYKWITWGKILNKELEQYTFYPIYDWSTSDIWSAIHKNGWKYNEIYDYQYRYGVSVQNMRVSNLHHETAIKALTYLQEVDKVLYDKMVKRVKGVDTAGKIQGDFFPKKLPFMFKDWAEYADYLAEKLVTDEKLQKKISSFSKRYRMMFTDNPELFTKAFKVIVSTIIAGDVAGTKIKNFENTVAGFYARDVLHITKLKGNEIKL